VSFSTHQLAMAQLANGRLVSLCERLRSALRTARSHIITLGGDARKYPEDQRDMIQADVLEIIDAALEE